jgi:hypothetical protein
LIRVRINELARPEQGLAANDIHRPGHRDVERGAAAVRHRIDLPVDGLRNVGKPAVRRLTLLRLTRDVLLAKPTNIYQLDVGRTVLGGSADGAVLISREGPLLVGARVTGLDPSGGTVVETSLFQLAPTWKPAPGPSPSMFTSPPILKLKPGGVTGALTLVAGGSRVDLLDCRSGRRHDIDLVPQRIRDVHTDTLEALGRFDRFERP